MEIGDNNRIGKLGTGHNSILQTQSSPGSTVEMTVVLNESNTYWTSEAPLRCASNADLLSADGQVRRDYKFQVIQVRSGPRWFIFPSNKSEDESVQTPDFNGSYDQENQNNSTVRRSIRPHRKASNEFNMSEMATNNGFAPYEGDLCKATVTTTISIPAIPESTASSHPINAKAIDCCFQATDASSLSMSPPSASSECSTLSNQSTLSSCASDTFQILSVAKKCEDEEEYYEDPDDSSSISLLPKIFVSSDDETKSI